MALIRDSDVLSKSICYGLILQVQELGDVNRSLMWPLAAPSLHCGLPAKRNRGTSSTQPRFYRFAPNPGLLYALCPVYFKKSSRVSFWCGLSRAALSTCWSCQTAKVEENVR